MVFVPNGAKIQAQVKLSKGQAFRGPKTQETKSYFGVGYPLGAPSYGPPPSLPFSGFLPAWTWSLGESSSIDEGADTMSWDGTQTANSTSTRDTVATSGDITVTFSYTITAGNLDVRAFNNLYQVTNLIGTGTYLDTLTPDWSRPTFVFRASAGAILTISALSVTPA